VRHLRPDVCRLLVSCILLHSTRCHACCRRQINTNTPTQFPLPVGHSRPAAYLGCRKRRSRNLKSIRPNNSNIKNMKNSSSVWTLRRNFQFSETSGIGSASSSGNESRFRGTIKSDESRMWLSRRRQRHCVSDDDETDPDSPCSASGVPVVVETNIDRPHSTAAYGRIADNPTSTRSQLDQTASEGRVHGGRSSSPAAGSALELPDLGELGGESESSLSGDMSPIRRSRFDVDDTTTCPSPTSRRVDVSRRQRQQQRPTQIYSARPEPLHNRSVVYINMLAVSGSTRPGRTAPGRISSVAGVKVNSRERRAERTLLWVFLAFVVLWLPFFCANLTYGLCRSCEVPADVFAAFTWLGYLSSGVNPCIYTYLNSDFRKAFRNILACRRLAGRSSRFPRQYS